MSEQSTKRSSRRQLTGVVSSNKMSKTVVVVVQRRVLSERFRKYITTRAKYKAHSGDETYNVGDRVTIVESRPLSREKRWRVQKLVERAKNA